MRAAILEAANRLIERNGPEALTLSAVASEAHIARATVYGYFSSKKDLFSQVGLTASEENNEPEAATDSPAAFDTTEAAPTAETAIAEPAPAPEAEATAPAGEPAGEEYRELMKAQADALHKIAGRVIVPKSLMKEGTDSVLSRVEARLSVAEQSAAKLERRMDEQAKNYTGQISAVSETVQQLQTRVKAFEQRQQTAVAELRLDLHNLMHTGKDEPHTVPPSPEAAPDIVPEIPQEPEPQAEPEPAAATPAADNYLSTARRAAITASQIVVQKPPRRPSLFPRLRFGNKRRVWLILGLAALAVAAFDTFVLASFPPRAATQERAIAPAIAPANVTKPHSIPARAALGDAKAQLILGMRLLNGTGVATNVEKAAQWLERAAVAGQPVAQNYVGVLYQTGTGVPADMAKAIRWYEASAQHGNVKAMTNLGKVYAGGWEEGTDYENAAHWFGRAAALGDVDAQFDLAILYERGEGVSRSIPEAYKWYAIAAAQGDKNAETRTTMLAARLTPDELQSAQRAIAAFKPDNIDRAANDTPPAAQTPN
jgi:TPR repeat protein